MGPEEQPKTIDMVFALNQLSDKNAGRREWAEDHIRKQGPSITATLLRTIEKEGLKRKRRRRVLGWLLLIYVSLFLSFVFWFLARGLWTGHVGRLPDWFMAAVYVIPASGFIAAASG